MTKIWIVSVNSDMTEGRGPILFNSAFDSFEAAEYYVLNQEGYHGQIRGPDSGKPWKDGTMSYDGWFIRETVLKSFSDVEDVLQVQKEIEELETQRAVLDAKIRAMKS